MTGPEAPHGDPAAGSGPPPARPRFSARCRKLGFPADPAVGRHVKVEADFARVRTPPVQLDQPRFHHVQAVEEASDLGTRAKRGLGVTHPLVEPLVRLGYLAGIDALGWMGDDEIAARG